MEQDSGDQTIERSGASLDRECQWGVPDNNKEKVADIMEMPRLSAAFSAGKLLVEGQATTCEECVAISATHYPNGLNANFLTGDESQVVADHIARFENPESRDIAKAVPDIMHMLKTHAGVGESSVVADIGAGTGLFLSPLSSAVKKVYAMEISPHFLAHLRKQVKVQRLQNIVVVEGSAKDPSLPPNSIDVAFICDVYHHFEYPKTFCGHLKQALRPGGCLVIIDFIRDEAVHKSHPPGWIMEHVRAGQEVFRAEIESAGFKHVSEPQVPSLAENYCMIFEC